MGLPVQSSSASIRACKCAASVLFKTAPRMARGGAGNSIAAAALGEAFANAACFRAGPNDNGNVTSGLRTAVKEQRTGNEENISSIGQCTILQSPQALVVFCADANNQW